MFNRVLLKRAFLSLFKNRLFTVLMILLVLISGGTYTVFQSVASSFSQSYAQVVDEGALHDVVVKENFRSTEVDNVRVNQIFTSEGSYAPLDEANLQSNAALISGTTNYRITVATSQAYPAIGLTSPATLTLNFRVSTINNALNWTEALSRVTAASAELENLVTRRLNASLANSYASALRELYPTELDVASRASIAVLAGTRAYKVVQLDPAPSVNRLVTYSGEGALDLPLSDEALRTRLERQIVAANGGEEASLNRYSINALKGYRVTASDALQQVQSVTDESAVQAIVSPSYAAANSKSTISRAALLDLVTEGWKSYVTPSATVTNFYDALTSPQLLADYANSIVMVDATPYFIVGTGVTPDFAYPIISEAAPNVNVAMQAVVYVNSRGYERITDAFRTNAQENYIAARFKPGVSAARQDAIISQLNELAKVVGGAEVNGVKFPQNLPFTASTRMVTRANDSNDPLTLTYERSAFLNTLQSTISTVSWITTTLLAIFVAVVVVMVFNVLIVAQRKSLATLLALGYTRASIAFSTAFIAFLIGALPAIAGYLIGFGSQSLLTGAFADYWTLPTFAVSFSWPALLIVVGLPTVLMFFLIGLIVWGSLFHPLPSMLRDAVWDSTNFVEKLLRPFRGLPIRIKYGLALTLRNGGRLVFVGLATTSAATALMISFSTIGRANEAYAQTLAVSNYEYKVDLYSPTREGGQYQRVVYAQKDGNWGYFYNNEPLSYAPTYDPSTPISARTGPHWHVPSFSESAYALPGLALNAANNQPGAVSAADVARYLSNKLQIKRLIDQSLGLFNPWDTARQLMPENQRNLAVQNDEDLRNSYLSKIERENLDLSDRETLFTRLLSEQVPRRDASLNVQSALYQPFIISYGLVVTNEGDEPYTYIDSSFDLGEGINNYKVSGIDLATKMYNLTPEAKAALTGYQGSNVPVLISRYLETARGLAVGSTFSGTVNNHLDRNANGFTAPPITYEVVGVLPIYSSGGLITTKERANALLGMDAAAFNGILSVTANNALLSTLPLYSPSGFYLPTDTISAGSPWANVLTRLLSNDAVWSAANRANYASDLPSFLAKYSPTLFAPLVAEVDWREISSQVFASAATLSATLINVVQTVTLAISLIFSVIVASLIIRINRKRIATLWALGYRRGEVLRIFSGQFILPLVLSLAIAAPISVAILFSLQAFIITFGAIFIPFSLVVWAPFVVILILAGIFFLATVIGIFSLSPRHALAAFREDA